MKAPFIIAFIKSSKGKIFFSVILGFGIATLFRESCKNRNCLIFRAPSTKEFKNKIFSHDKRCYVYNEKPTKCDSSKKILDISN